MPAKLRPLRTLLLLWLCTGLLLPAAALAVGRTWGCYTAAQSGSDTARVAAPRLAAEIKVNDASTYTLTVTNVENGAVCEVALRYDVVITLDEKLPDGVTLTMDGNEVVFNGTDGRVVGAGALPAGTGDTQTHTLAVNGTPETSQELTVAVTVVAEQLD